MAIVIKSEDNLYRYVLSDGSGQNKLYIMGINPSNATVENGNRINNNGIIEENGLLNSDPTIETVRNIANHHGFDYWAMLNIYPQRSPMPNNLPLNYIENEHLININEICNIVSDNSVIFAGWGDSISIRPYLRVCLNEIATRLNNKNVQWKCAELTRRGNPKHPLYFRRINRMDILYQPFINFDIAAYFE